MLALAPHHHVEDQVPAPGVLADTDTNENTMQLAAEAGDEVAFNVQLNPLLLFYTHLSFSSPHYLLTFWTAPNNTCTVGVCDTSQKCAGGIFWHTSSGCACAVLPYPVSVLVPATQNLLLWQHNYIFSRAVAAVSFKRGRDCVVRACVSLSRCTPLHSTLTSSRCLWIPLPS